MGPMTSSFDNTNLDTETPGANSDTLMETFCPDDETDCVNGKKWLTKLTLKDH